MIDSGSAFRYQQIIIPGPLIQLRPFGNPHRRPGVYLMNRSGQFTGRRVVFLQHDTGEIIVVLAEIPAHIEQPFAPVIVMEEERVEAAAVQADRAAPGTL
ncbi:hypothetical protein D3C75_1174640 [compost metagenome]